MKTLQRATTVRELNFGLMYFASSEQSLNGEGDKYSLLFDGARYADRHGFSSVWVPERHFSRMGCLYPNPAVLAASLAMVTENVRLCAGSLVLPLHNPIRVAEEWAVVDHLSKGRIGMSMASGWNSTDFTFFPEKFPNRRDEMHNSILVLKKIWSGEKLKVRSGIGQKVEVTVYPPPYQAELPLWLTAAKTPGTFIRAGELGGNILTHLLDQDMPTLAKKIALYREARARSGYPPETGYVTCMLHTFLGEDADEVREIAREPYCNYLKSTTELTKQTAIDRRHDVDLDQQIDEKDVDAFVQFLYKRFVRERAIIGTPQTALDIVGRLYAAGVDEIACLLDFGPPDDLILENLKYIVELKTMIGSLDETAYVRETEHVQAPAPQATTTTETSPAVLDLAGEEDRELASIKRRCAEEIEGKDFYADLSANAIEFDASQSRIERLWRQDGEALGWVEPGTPQETSGPKVPELPGFPQPLLDSCLQVAVAAVPREMLVRQEGEEDGETDPYLPVGFRSLEAFKPLPDRVWSHVVLRSDPTGDGDVLEANVRILNAEGEGIAEIQGLRLERAEALEPIEPETVADWLYVPIWEPTEPATLTEKAGRWMILADGGGLGEGLEARLRERGDECVLVSVDSLRTDAGNLCPDAFHELIGEHVVKAETPCSGIVYLLSLDTAPPEETSAASLMADQEQVLAGLILLVQALVSVEGVRATPILAVTRGVEATGVESQPLALAQAPLWGLARTLTLEHPNFSGGLLDLDPASSPDEAVDHLFQMLLGEGRENQVMFRHGQRYVFRVVREEPHVDPEAEDEAPPPTLTVHPDASYLITGGLVGLGFENARWLVQRGAQHLILLGRTEVPPRESWDGLERGSREADIVAHLRELEGLGAQVFCPAMDVTDEEQVRSLFERLEERRQPPIRGVFHAASVWRHKGETLVRPIAQTTVESLELVLPPKMLGAWLLQKYLEDAPLDFFMMYSAVGTLAGSGGQGNYTAANSFLDTMAQEMRRQGRPALSLNLGPVKEIGFGATAEGKAIHELWERRGIMRLEAAELIEAFELLLPRDYPQIALMKTIWEKLMEGYAGSTGAAWASHLVELEDEEQEDLVAKLEEAPAEERHEILATHLQREVMRVMGLSEAEAPELDQGLFETGLDSLLALDLKNRIDATVKAEFPATAIFDYPTIEGLSKYLLTHILKLDIGETEEESHTVEEVDLLTDIEELSEEEAEAMLAQKVMQTGT